MTYLNKHIENPTKTPQSKPLAGQVENSAGGHSWKVDCWTRLHRFLILGSEGGSYYAGEHDLTQENLDCIVECLKEDGVRTVKTIKEISLAGRAPKNDPAILALAMACVPKWADDETREWAFAAIQPVCRTGTHLFTFCNFVDQMRGWGRGLRRGVAAWYEDRDVSSLDYQLIKYRQRGGWTHRDVLRSCHAKSDDFQRSALFDYACRGAHPGFGKAGVISELEGADEKAWIAAIEEHDLPREVVPTEMLKSRDIWNALLGKMPMTAMIRNLATMTRVGLLVPNSAAATLVEGCLTNADILKQARVHPIQVLSAMLTYSSGHGVRSDATWNPVTGIVDALDEAFYGSFGNVEPTGKRRLLAIDVSGSMSSGELAGVPRLSPRVAAGAMAMVAAHTGDPYECVAFTGPRWSYRDVPKSEPITVLPLSKRQRLDDVCRMLDRQDWGATDCALPVAWADANDREFDSFEVYTDSETWAGRVHPSQALQHYRNRLGIPAKMTVIGMVSNGFSIADPDDPHMMDVVGFDTATPSVIENFIRE